MLLKIILFLFISLINFNIFAYNNRIIIASTTSTYDSGLLDYINKESKDIKYTLYNLGLHHKSGLKAGLSVKEQEPLLSVGFNKKFKKYWLEYNIDISAKTDFEDNNIWNIKSEVKRHIGKYNIFGLYKHEYYNNKEDFQFKVGVGIQL